MTPATATRGKAKAGPVLVFNRPTSAAQAAPGSAAISRVNVRLARLNELRPGAAQFIARLIDDLLKGYDDE